MHKQSKRPPQTRSRESGQARNPAPTTSTGYRQQVAAAQSMYGNQAVLRMLERSREAFGGQAAPPTLQRAADGAGRTDRVPPIVHEILRGPGQPLDPATRNYFEPRFGEDFSRVRVYAGDKPAESARAVDALAYTVGRNMVFAKGQYAPSTPEGRRLLAHELTHVVQQNSAAHLETPIMGNPSDRLEREAEDVSRTSGIDGVSAQDVTHDTNPVIRRTPARKVDCASTAPLKLPGGGEITDPVGTISAAERRANDLLDAAVSELESTRQRILTGSPVGWPTVSDNLGFAMQLLGLDPNSERTWKAAGGSGTAALLLYRLKWFRKEIGSGDFFFTCLGPAQDEFGKPICGTRIETPTEVFLNELAIARTDQFHIYLCEPFWTGDEASPDHQASTLIHETAHTFGDFIQDDRTSGPHVGECYARFTLLVAAGIEVGGPNSNCPHPSETSSAGGGK